MTDFKQRLLVEQSELLTKTENLKGFLSTPAFKELPVTDRVDLTEQSQHMERYLKVLDRRVTRLVGGEYL
jgi:hypothetical protein